MDGVQFTEMSNMKLRWLIENDNKRNMGELLDFGNLCIIDNFLLGTLKSRLFL